MDKEFTDTKESVASNVDAGLEKKADLVKRSIALVIDSFIAGLIGVIFQGIPVIGRYIGLLYLLTRDGFGFSFMDGRSLGKKIMKLRPVRLDGQKMDLMTSIKRNITMVIPFLGLIEAIMVLVNDDGYRIGDRIGETKVIEVTD